MKRVTLFLFFLYYSIIGIAQTNIVQDRDTTAIRIKIIDKEKNPVFGVYVIDKNKSYLLTTSDIDGECQIHPRLVGLQDSIQFQGIGYQTVSYTLQQLKKIPLLVLEELSYDLNETVIKGFSTKQLLEKASAKLKKLPRNTPPYCNYYGQAQYEKITTYRDTAVEYRREFGYYFTSGDIKPRNIWDQSFRSYFVPVYTARSLNLTNNGSDTLTPVYMTTEETRFDAGTRKIFTLFRTIQLYAPLFAGTRNYEIQPIETDNMDYMYSFRTRTDAYPDDTRISCKGTFTIDFQRHELKTMTFDYIDYQLYRQVILTNKRKVSSPFSSKARIHFSYDNDGQVYIRSCILETRWKYDLGDNFIIIEQPSRMHPAAGNLIEQEAFACYTYEPVEEPFKTAGIGVKIHVAQRNPVGNYDSLLFRKLPLLLDNQRAIKDLNRYSDLETQYRYNDNKTYYPDNFMNGFNGFIGAGRDDKAFRQNTRKVRSQLFEIFSPARLLENDSILTLPEKIVPFKL